MELYKINGREKKSIILESDIIRIIKSKGFISNLKEKSIPIKSIIDIKVEKPGKILAGSIQLQTAGELSRIIFTNSNDYETALKIKDYVITHLNK